MHCSGFRGSPRKKLPINHEAKREKIRPVSCCPLLGESLRRPGYLSDTHRPHCLERQHHANQSATGFKKMSFNIKTGFKMWPAVTEGGWQCQPVVLFVSWWPLIMLTSHMSDMGIQAGIIKVLATSFPADLWTARLLRSVTFCADELYFSIFLWELLILWVTSTCGGYRRSATCCGVASWPSGRVSLEGWTSRAQSNQDASLLQTCHYGRGSSLILGNNCVFAQRGIQKALGHESPIFLAWADLPKQSRLRLPS